MFEDVEFHNACEEIDHPDISEWEYFTQSYSKAINIYRLYNEKSGLYSYKTIGTMDIPPELCCQVYLDLEYRKVWDSYVKEIRDVSNGERSGIYWLLNYPFPLSKRDFVYQREMRELTTADGQHVWVILSKTDNVLNDYEARSRSIVRIQDCCQRVAITSNGAGGSKAFSYYYDDPGGLIPSWVINWAAKTGVPAFLANVEKACHDYPEYVRHRKSSADKRSQRESNNKQSKAASLYM